MQRAMWSFGVDFAESSYVLKARNRGPTRKAGRAAVLRSWSDPKRRFALQVTFARVGYYIHLYTI